MRRFAVAVVTTGVVALVNVSVAVASGWSIERTVKPAQGSVMSGVSCASERACAAVGHYDLGRASRMLAERWNGARWSLEPIPKEGVSSFLAGVSCVSASDCNAVGNYTKKYSGGKTLAEHWNGTRWSVVPTPNGGVLVGVSCVSRSSCVAVGHGSYGALVERWDGVGWSIESTPTPAGGGRSQLNGVSCVSPIACTAVGYQANGHGSYVTLAESWNGTTWSIEPTPNPNNATGSFLTSVSCVSASACTAVGHYSNGMTDVTLAERWNGTDWSIQPTPNPRGGSNSRLGSVSCPSLSACTAVGHYSQDKGGGMIAERWNGVSWVLERIASPRSGAMAGVSCVSVSACAAVGNYNNGVTVTTLAESWNGARWSAKPSPAGSASDSLLAGVWCASASACLAVGRYSEGARDHTLAERWDGTRWSVQHTLNANHDPSNLVGLSCATMSACTAVGSYYAGAGSRPTAARWNGARWSVQRVPNPPHGLYSDSELTGVSCPSASTCTAVGYHDNSHNFSRALAERWSGRRWSIMHTPKQRGPHSSRLTAVSCVSARVCIAVGYRDHDGRLAALAERWNGRRWSIEPTPTRGRQDFLTGVSCPSASDCTAVGYRAYNGTLAERWNGKRWSIEPTPHTKRTSRSELTGVSCASASACTAVGFELINGRPVILPLAERWNGKRWSIERAPTPNHPPDSQLTGVSCPSAGFCTAVGYESKYRAGTAATLAERWIRPG